MGGPQGWKPTGSCLLPLTTEMFPVSYLVDTTSVVCGRVTEFSGFFPVPKKPPKRWRRNILGQPQKL